MRPFSLLGFVVGVNPSQQTKIRRCKASGRELSVESLESRVAPSALAVLLDFEATKYVDVVQRLDIDDVIASAARDRAVTVGSLRAEVETHRLPVVPSIAMSAEVELPELLRDPRAIAVVMQMGPAAWQPVTPAGDSGEMVSMTQLSGPGPLPPGGSIITDPITVDEPVIVAFSASSPMYNQWYFEGEVLHDQPQELIIVFGGLLEGEVTNVTTEGAFSFSWPLPPGTQGYVTAQAWTPEGVGSNVAKVSIS